MADFIEIRQNGYRIVVQPNDRFRRFLAEFGLGGLVPYFDATNIYFDMRIFVPKQRHMKDIDDSITYEWLLCDEDCKPLANIEGAFRFFNVTGNNVFDISTDKGKLTTLIKSKGILHSSTRYIHTFRKLSAINVGFAPKASRYNIVMRFTCSSTGVTSDYKPALRFTLFDKDKIRYAFLISLITIFTTAVVGLVLRLYGITP